MGRVCGADGAVRAQHECLWYGGGTNSLTVKIDNKYR